MQRNHQTPPAPQQADQPDQMTQTIRSQIATALTQILTLLSQ